MKKKEKKSRPENVEREASANEATGSLQRVVPTDGELKKFNKEYNNGKS